MWLTVAGAIIIAGAVWLVYSKRDVSTGHAAMVAAGALLIALHEFSSFEIGKDGFKFTSREQGEVLTAKLESAVEQIGILQESLGKLTTAMDEGAKRISAIEIKTGMNTDPGIGSWVPGKYDPEFFNELLRQNDASKAVTSQQLNDLERFKKTFLVDPSQPPLTWELFRDSK